ncbi:hypothetical protein INT47_003427 [Mucor saturninus]|uniref:AB hydrolase-1 domain-containing protein n=1 Tax=Mucor saturninus TaxID=64648 RepID=A0A8H7V4M5_9FUNG|nr:hypothetical protein INT47_003427 [Mucor saturninus]
MAEQCLQVDGANLCYEIEGSGPYIVFVAGGNGGHLLFKHIRDILVKYFTVVLYDRRGYFRSKLTGPQDYSKNVDTNVEDLYILMRKITVDKFIFFGVSGSAAIGLKYLTAHPETISKMFIHEPLLYLENFPGINEARGFHYYAYRIFHIEGQNACMNLAGNFYFNELDRQIFLGNQKKKKINNWSYWFEHEFCEDLFTKMNLDLIKVYSDKLIFLHGVESRDSFIHEPGAFIADTLGKVTLPFPGGHTGFYTRPEEFSADFLEICRVNFLLKYQTKL